MSWETPPSPTQQINLSQQNVENRQQILVQQVDPNLLEAYVQSRIGAVYSEAKGVIDTKDQQLQSAAVALSAQ